MAQQGQAGLLQHPLQTQAAGGVGTGGQTAEITLQIAGRGQEAQLHLGDRNRPIWPGGRSHGAIVIGKGRTTAATPPQGIGDQTHDGHQHQKAKQAAAAKAKDRQQEWEANATAHTTAIATTAAVTAPAIATPAIAAGHGGGGAKATATNAAATGGGAGFGMNQQES